jgi:WD40 repeat protein
MKVTDIIFHNSFVKYLPLCLALLISIGCISSFPSTTKSKPAVPNKNEVNASHTPTPLPIGVAGKRDLQPPSSEEQRAAAEAFESYVINKRMTYRNCTYETLTKNETSATVKIEFEDLLYLPNANNPEIYWLDEYANIALYYVNGNWEVDEEDIAITSNPKADIILDKMAEETLPSDPSNSTAEALSRTLGGLFIYHKYGNSQILVIRDSGGHMTEIAPEVKGQTGWNYYDNLVISPNKQVIYFSVDIDNKPEPAIYYSDLKGEKVHLIKQFPKLTFIFWISISPDNQFVAVELGNIGEDTTIWILPASGGEGNLIYKFPNNVLLTNPVWNQDSKYFFAGVYHQGDYSMTLNKFGIDGSMIIGKKLPTIQSDETQLLYDLIAISPDGKNLAYGGNKLGLFNLDSGKNSVLFESENTICKPAFNKDGNKILFVEDNILYNYDLKTGSKNFIFDFLESPDYRCIRNFGWLP